MISAKIILDSINPARRRITTFELTYPRFIHSEFMTHRAFSRNAASSRAIPIERMLVAVADKPALPEYWAANQSGMQATAEINDDDLIDFDGDLKTARTHAKLEWVVAADDAIEHARALSRLGAHKAIANRVLEPFSHITVVCTATYYANFFSLRAHPMAQQEFQVLAYRMLDVYLKSQPTQLCWNEWHVPYVSPEDRAELPERELAKVSAARCARVSYLNQNGVRSIADDLALYDRLVAQVPLHASALEHPAQAWGHGSRPQDASNFHNSWRQFRKDHHQENVTEINLAEVLANKPDWITL